MAPRQQKRTELDDHTSSYETRRVVQDGTACDTICLCRIAIMNDGASVSPFARQVVDAFVDHVNAHPLDRPIIALRNPYADVWRGNTKFYRRRSDIKRGGLHS